VTSFNEKNSKQVSTTTKTISYLINSDARLTYSVTKNTDDGICNFNGYCSLKTNPATAIIMGLHFEKSGAIIKDTLYTPSFSKLMDFNNIKRIQIDSLTYNVRDEMIKLEFIISLIRVENDKGKIVDKYSMVYSSGFKNPKPTMNVEKIEKSLIQIIGNTY